MLLHSYFLMTTTIKFLYGFDSSVLLSLNLIKHAAALLGIIFCKEMEQKEWNTHNGVEGFVSGLMDIIIVCHFLHSILPLSLSLHLSWFLPS